MMKLLNTEHICRILIRNHVRNYLYMGFNTDDSAKIFNQAEFVVFVLSIS